MFVANYMAAASPLHQQLQGVQDIGRSWAVTSLQTIQNLEGTFGLCRSRDDIGIIDVYKPYSLSTLWQLQPRARPRTSMIFNLGISPVLPSGRRNFQFRFDCSSLAVPDTFLNAAKLSSAFCVIRLDVLKRRRVRYGTTLSDTGTTLSSLQFLPLRLMLDDLHFHCGS